MPPKISDEERVMTFFQTEPLEKAETVFNMMRSVLAARGAVVGKRQRKPRVIKAKESALGGPVRTSAAG